SRLSATNETRIKQCFLSRRIEGADNPLLAGPRSDRCRKACAGQFPETPLGLFDLRAIMDVECVAGVTGTIHHDLGCHFRHSEFLLPEAGLAGPGAGWSIVGPHSRSMLLLNWAVDVCFVGLSLILPMMAMVVVSLFVDPVAS